MNGVDATFERIMLKKLKEQMELRSARLASGGASDYAQYTNQVGFIGGLKEAEELCKEVRKAMFGEN